MQGTQQDTFGHVTQAPVPFGRDAVEWALAPIEVDSTRNAFRGKSSPQVAATVSPMQPAGTTVQCDCNWQFQQTSP